MRTGTIAFIAGISLYHVLAWPLGLASALLLPLTAYLGVKYRPTGLICLFACGFIWCGVIAEYQLTQQLPDNLQAQDLTILGKISSPVEFDFRRIRFQFDVKQAWLHGEPVDFTGRVRLSWFRQPVSPKAGQIWRLRVKMKKPHGFLNPGGFDYEGWLFRHSILATGYVRQGHDNQLKAESDCLIDIQCWRQTLADNIDRLVQDKQIAGLIKAISLGLRHDLEPEQQKVFAQTGTSHLIAISGLHIGLIAGFVFFLVARLWTFTTTGCLRWPATKVAAIAAIMAALLYALIAGMSLPTQRALIMISVFMLNLLRQKKTSFIDNLFVAALLIAVIYPFSISEPGFWLSFLAVGIILLITRGRLQQLKKFTGHGRMQLLIIIGMFPVLAIVFGQVSLVSPLANLLFIPFMSLLIIPVSLLGVVLLPLSDVLAGLLFKLVAFGMHLAMPVLDWLASRPLATLHFPALPTSLCILLICATGIILLPRYLPGRWLGLIACLPVFLFHTPSPDYGGFSLTLLDVGQGLSTVIQTQHHTLLFDTGAKFSERFNAGDAVILPYLRSQGIQQLDTLVISHTDNDHIGGFKAVITSTRVKRLYSGEQNKLRDYAAVACHQGVAWQWDGVMFTFLAPFQDSHARKTNNRSCVLKINSRYGSALLTGDIEAKVERQLLRRERAMLDVDVLIAPHHGSKTSSSGPFIRAVSPQYVLYPVGYRNRFHHPAMKIVRRYRENGVKQLDTAHSGAIRIMFSGRGNMLKPEIYRKTSHRPWRQGDGKPSHFM